jgi:hypothetical protein
MFRPLALVIAFSSLAAADPADQLVKSFGSQLAAWYQDSTTKAWLLRDGFTDGTNPARCTKALEELAAANVPDTMTFEVAADSRDLTAGRHSVAEGRIACAAIERAGKVKWFEQRAQIAADINSTKMLEQCSDIYKQIVAAGVPPTERVPERDVMLRGKTVRWSGTIEEIRVKYCEGGLEAQRAEKAAREAPYRAVMKNDKLQLVLDTFYPVFGGFTLIGGKHTEDPKALAAATVWFYGKGLTGETYCARGTKHVVTVVRVAFDRNGKRIGKSEKTYCGDPPDSAFQ